MPRQSIYHTYKRYRTLQTSLITALPVAILMPHSGCNCRCVMCDIWKGNRNVKQLTEGDISGLLDSFRRLGTRQVLMSGGEALLHPAFFRFCEMLRSAGLRISLHSTGISVAQHAQRIAAVVDDLVVSLDGDETTHDSIRSIPGAFRKLKEGIRALRAIDPGFRITGRCVIHRLNFRRWPQIVEAAKELGLDRISFLPADVSSTAFNRDIPWTVDRQADVMITMEDLPVLQQSAEDLFTKHANNFDSGFIAESREKIGKIVTYYSALNGLCAFPYKKCNAPWVSAVVEPDGYVRPCFFHPVIGNLREQPLHRLLNLPPAIAFRKTLNMDANPVCERCVCYLNLSPATSFT